MSCTPYSFDVNGNVIAVAPYLSVSIVIQQTGDTKKELDKASVAVDKLTDSVSR